MKELEQQHHNTFEELKQIDENGNEFWYARNLSKRLGYVDFRNFLKVIEKAKKACLNSNNEISDHLVEVTEVVEGGSGVSNPYPSFNLSRYACYLVVQNADPSRPVVASGQTYFALQTRRAELQDDETFRQLKEEEKLKRENIQSKTQANKVHNEVCKKVRQTIKELGETMLEDLPTPQKSTLKIAEEQKKIESKDDE